MHKHLRALRQIELLIRRFVGREFLELFTESDSWQAAPVTLDDVRLGTNFVRLSFGCSAVAGGILPIAIDAQALWLLAGIPDPGWIGRLLPHQRQLLVTAILGLYKAAGIDLVRQQIESEFPPPAPWYDVSAEGLVVWPNEQGDVEIFYNLREGPWVAPQNIRGLPRRRMPTVERWRFVFNAAPLPWNRWVEVWNYDLAGRGHPRDPIVPVRVLPPLS